MTLETMRWHEKITLQYCPDDYRRRGVIKLVKPFVNGKRVLDMRTLTGHLAVELIEKGFEVSALDGYEEAVRMTNSLAQSRGISKEIARQWDLVGLAERFGADKFDSVLALDILNHVDDDEQTLKEISTVTKAGGRLILLVPAYPSLLCERDKYFAHLRRYGRKDLVRFLERHGFEIKCIRYWNFLAFPFYFLAEKVMKKKISDGMRYTKTGRPISLFKKFLIWWYETIESRLIFPFGLSHFVIAEKKYL